MKYVFLFAAVMTVAAVIIICIFLFANGIPAMAEIGFFDFLLGTEWKPSNIPPSFGIFPMILGSLMVTLGAIIIGVPIGILTSVFMAHYCPKKPYRILKPGVELLAGIPSVIYGFFGLVVLVPLIRTVFGGNGNSILSGSTTTSTDWDNIKVGQILSAQSTPTDLGRIYGHTGIYIGDGMVMDNIGYVRTISLTEWLSFYSSYGWVKYGWPW